MQLGGQPVELLRFVGEQLFDFLGMARQVLVLTGLVQVLCEHGEQLARIALDDIQGPHPQGRWRAHGLDFDPFVAVLQIGREQLLVIV